MAVDPAARPTEVPPPPGARAHRRRGRRDRAHPRPDAEPPRAGHVRGDVVGALLLQVVPHPPAAPADRGAARAGRPGRGRRRGRRRRRHRRRLPHREPQPPVGHRALPGRGHRRRRHPPRRLLRRRPSDRPDGSAPVRPAGRPPQPLDRRGRRVRRLRLWQLRRRARPSAARPSSTPPIRTTRSSTCSASGCCPHERLVLARASGVGNLAVLFGSSTGRDGIGGASVLASAGFGEDGADDDKRPSVQVGDPFEEKRLIEACLEILDAGLVVGIQDLGAAGHHRRRQRDLVQGRRRDGRLPVRGARPRGGHGALRGHDQREPGADARHRRARATSTTCSRSARKWEIRASVIGTVTGTGPLPRARPPRRRGAGRHPGRVARRRRPAVRPAPARSRRAGPSAAPIGPCRRRRPTPAPTCSSCWSTPRGCSASTTTSCSSTPSRARAATPPCCGSSTPPPASTPAGASPSPATATTAGAPSTPAGARRSWWPRR